jgi:hypothetical protein
MGEVFAFQVDLAPAQKPGEPLCEIKRGRSADIRSSQMIQIFLKRLVSFCSLIGNLEFVECRNESLWRKSPAVIPEIAFFVR